MSMFTLSPKMFLGAPLFSMACSGDAVFLLSVFFGAMIFHLVRLGSCVRRKWIGWNTGGSNFIKLSLPRVTETEPESLCASCVFAHVVRGYRRGEEIVACGYAFPPRDILFAVRECTDHKPKRECSGAEIAYEGAVSLPPLEDKAANFRAAPAARQACGS
jgi:hypothetical protein